MENRYEKMKNLPVAEEESRQVDMQNRSKQLAQKKRRASEVSCRRTLAPSEKRNGDIFWDNVRAAKVSAKMMRQGEQGNKPHILHKAFTLHNH